MNQSLRLLIKLYNTFWIIGLFQILVSLNCSSKQENLTKSSDNSSNLGEKEWSFPIKKLGLNKSSFNKLEPVLREKKPSAIVLHTTGSLNAKDYAELSLAGKFFFHVLIDSKGNVYSEENIETLAYRLIPKMDLYTIHIAVEGKESEILNNPTLLKILTLEIDKLSVKFFIPPNNKNIESFRGIFTHTQAKKKFGNFIDLEECGGEKLLQHILNNMNGKYYPETDWNERTSKDWVLRKEDLNKRQAEEIFTHGRGITPKPFAALESIEQDENGFIIESKRVQYVFDTKIDPTCIVLHFTAIPDYDQSLKTLEMRRLSATLMIDKNGKIYQLLDSIDHSARAAGGTNNNCIQIEIVGKNTNELMSNNTQYNQVVKVVKELTSKYYIPLNNQRIESFKGIFSHTQAKKKWGKSVALIGKDFDPGEPYMKRVIEELGGTYYPEEEWYDRKSDDWILLFGEFQP
jgi:N-acetylmuramoyl-L-alanine amidase